MRRVWTLGLSAFVHLAVLGGASVTWLFEVAAVSEPPVVIRFVRALPPAPRIESFQAMQDEPPPPVEPESPVLEVPPPQAPEPTIPPTPVQEPPAPPLEPLESTASAKIQEIDLPLPEAMAHPRSGSPHDALSPGSVDAFTPRGISPGLREGPGPEAPGSPYGRRDLLAGTPGGLRGSPGAIRPIPALPGAPDTGPRSGSPNARNGSGGTGQSSPDERANILGRRYSVHLVDARQLGRSTHDGWRYNQILPLLSEAYRRLAPLGGAKPSVKGVDDDIESVRIDPDAIQIAYRDGTRHVVVPTRDGLVALYVATGSSPHGKVEEAQRALGAMQRLLRDGVRS